jgi:acyl-CoA thioesterase I
MFGMKSLGLKRWVGNASGYGASHRVFNIALVALVLAAVLATPAAAQQKRLLIFGDSLVAGYGLPREAGFIAQLDQALKDAGHEVVLIDGGVSGDTSAGGSARIGWSLTERPTHALVELGANDALRGVNPKETKKNLQRILDSLERAHVPVLLAGMRAPRNFGDDYADEFDDIYGDISGGVAVALYPFFLEGVALQPELNQPDGIHPNVKGVAVIVQRILPDILKLLRRKPLR